MEDHLRIELEVSHAEVKKLKASRAKSATSMLDVELQHAVAASDHDHLNKKVKELETKLKESQAKNADARDEIRLLKVKNTGHSKDAAEGVPTSSNEAALGAKLKAIS